jgi:two-component system, chemotaxis family, sensor kinase CheA
MDNLVTMVGELVIAHQMAVQGAASMGAVGLEMQRTLAQVHKIVRDVQEVSMALRMVSLRGTFQRMTRLVRDVALKAGKEIACVTEGEEVELDRNVVEEITDPLVHMIRNACDHGLETATDRIRAGKNPTGRVTLKAYHSGGSIVMEIGDDGRGLRREKILAKARASGLIDPRVDEASIPDSEVFALIFLPGFSTAEKVTDISGRGVGMDVVRRNIEALRGKIEIRSTPGRGTTFLVHVPLTMAIIDGMVVRVGTERYVLPTLSIEHAFRPGGSDVSTVAGRGEVVNVRGRLLPIQRLGRLLGLESMTEPKDGLLVVVESAASKCALLVDEIVGQQQVVIKSLGGSQARGVAGGAILGDGRVALILDVGALRDSGHGTAHSTH